ncbi:MAG: type sorting protein [Mucilaginibacter sp.]|nr:type sorting protein [Mucilaginibacter sp.]
MCIKGSVALIKQNKSFFILLIGLLTGINYTSYAQLCTGSLGDPVVKIDFGAGTAMHGPQLPAGTTNYAHNDDDFPKDGTYTIENATTGNIWWNTKDHTGDTGGYMMVVNASEAKTDYFYKTTVTGLCPGTTFEFAAWIANLLRSSDISPPNITFKITSATDGTPLATYNTGTIPLTPSGLVWKQYGTYFKTPVGVSSVIIQMTNNSNGGAPANDLALDDITFRPCGPVISSNFIINNNLSPTAQTCAGQSNTYTLQASVVAGGFTNPVYQWQVNNGSGWLNIAGAIATTATVTVQSAVIGVYQYRMLASEAGNTGSAACQVASNLLTLTVPDAPVANFTFAGTNTSCLSNDIQFTDTSTGSNITSWLWDFTDGSTSTEQNPLHTFTGGTYPVKLTVTNSVGCPSSKTYNVKVVPKLLVNFDAVDVTCPNVPVTLTDKSIITNGTIYEWQWTFDDNTSAANLYTNAPFTHVFTTPGIHKVSLQVTSAENCVSDVFTKSITVLTGPTADFTLPDACELDGAQFTNMSTMPDGTTTGLTYQWNFGDPNNSTPSNPNTSTQQNPVHHYTKAGSYPVTLIVNSSSACQQGHAEKQFTVNSANPGTVFNVLTLEVCSGDSVSLRDKSQPVIGNVTRLEWILDNDNHPSVVIPIAKEALRSDKTYHFMYPLNTTTSPQTYHVVLRAYTGQLCSSDALPREVTVNPIPTATLTYNGSAIADSIILCQNDAPINIIATPSTGGTSTFSGTGITSAGVFDPKVSGAGSYTVNYAFVDNTGCNYITSFKVSVTAMPTITLAATTGVFEGGQLKLNPVITGNNLTYAWLPTTGISDATVASPIFMPAVNTTYTLTVTSGSGCSATAQVTISVLKNIVVPNTFTPNNDGINDTWEIQYLNTYPGATVDVFNRYGAKVFSSIGYPKPWDGKSHGADLPFGVYYYIINTRSGRKLISGSVTIVR